MILYKRCTFALTTAYLLSIMVNMNLLDTARKVQVVKCLCKGMSIRSTVRITGVAKNTIVNLLAEMGDACAHLHDRKMRGLKARRIQCDEIWSFVGCEKEERVAGAEGRRMGRRLDVDSNRR